MLTVFSCESNHALLSFVRGRVSEKGFGLERPLASNATAQGRSVNRRLEVSVVKEAR